MAGPTQEAQRGGVHRCEPPDEAPRGTHGTGHAPRTSPPAQNALPPAPLISTAEQLLAGSSQACHRASTGTPPGHVDPLRQPPGPGRPLRQPRAVPPYLERGHDLADHGQVQRVEGLGPVERDHTQAAMGAKEDLVLGGRRRRRAHEARLDLCPAWRAHGARSPGVRREEALRVSGPKLCVVRTRSAAEPARRANLTARNGAPTHHHHHHHHQQPRRPPRPSVHAAVARPGHGR